MTYDKHIFISYAHLDNQPLTPEQEGWVSRFHEALQAILSMRMGRPAKIWRDKKIHGTDDFAEEIVAQFPTTELLISVLSPCYVRSDWQRIPRCQSDQAPSGYHGAATCIHAANVGL